MPAGNCPAGILLFALTVKNRLYFSGRKAVFLVAEMALNFCEFLLSHLLEFAGFERGDSARKTFSAAVASVFRTEFIKQIEIK